MDKFDELMNRHALIFARWMQEVEESKARGARLGDLVSAGVVLRKNGILWMQGRNHNRQHDLVVELTIKPGETEVEVQRP